MSDEAERRAVSAGRHGAAWVSLVGPRKEQQDAAQVFGLGKTGNESAERGLLAVVADGVGGRSGGARASGTVVECARRAWEAGKFHDMPAIEAIEAVCREAYDAIVAGAENSKLAPSTTVVILLLREGRAWAGHLGDARLYHYRRGRCLYRTRDHSVAELLVAQGEIAEREVAGHPDQSRILKHLGGAEYHRIKVADLEVEPGDVFVLCTDGFWQRGRIRQLAVKAGAAARVGKLEELLQREAERAVKRNGPEGDNTTVAVVVAGGAQQPARRGLLARLFGGNDSEPNSKA